VKPSNSRPLFLIHPGIEPVLREHLARAYPCEGCGILIGKSTPDNRLEILRAIGTRNAETVRGEDRYAIDPRDLMMVEQSLIGNKDGLRIVGFFHSHPDSIARPSSTDLAMALGLFDVAHEFYVYAISSVMAGTPEPATYWTLGDDENGGLAFYSAT